MSEPSQLRPASEQPRGPERRHLRRGEMLLLFVLAPTGLALVMRPGFLFPAVWSLGAISLVWLLRDPTFERRRLWDWRGIGVGARVGPMLVRFVLCAGGLAGVLYLYAPERLLELPRNRPGLWGAIMLGYPILSVYPQEVAFRAFFTHRYAGLFRDRRVFVIVSTLAFAYAHIILHNWWAVGFTLVGGVFFATTYLRTRSLAAVCLEHALYGCFLFTIGWGWCLYHGTGMAR